MTQSHRSRLTEPIVKQDVFETSTCNRSTTRAFLQLDLTYVRDHWHCRDCDGHLEASFALYTHAARQLLDHKDRDLETYFGRAIDYFRRVRAKPTHAVETPFAEGNVNVETVSDDETLAPVAVTQSTESLTSLEPPSPSPGSAPMPLAAVTATTLSSTWPSRRTPSRTVRASRAVAAF